MAQELCAVKHRFDNARRDLRTALGVLAAAVGAILASTLGLLGFVYSLIAE